MKNMLSGRLKPRLVVGTLLLFLLIAGLLLAGTLTHDDKGEVKPKLLVMSSIPLRWGDANMADIASGVAQPSPLFLELSEENQPVMIDDFQALGGASSVPLLLVQPRALAPRELVQLDGWIRRGGKAIIFSDPALDWPSELPLGDQRRPLFTSLLTPMFRHWGLELALPVSDNMDKPDTHIGPYRIAPQSAGIWLRDNDKAAAANCAIRKDALIALCNVGTGQALLVADADLLQRPRWTDGLLNEGTMGWLGAVIATFRRKESLSGNLWEKE
jgi:hypothetical protein